MKKKMRKVYERPQMTVVELRHTTQLLQGSASLQDYTVNDYEEE